MSQYLNQDELNELAELLSFSPKVKAREALCIKIGISYYKELGFIYESSDSSFAINLISHLNEVGNTKAICLLCCKELAPIFRNGKGESLLKEIAVKLNCNQHLPDIKPSPVPPPDEPKPQPKRLNLLISVGAIFLIGLAGLAGFQTHQNPSPGIRVYLNSKDVNNNWQNWIIKPGQPNHYLIINKLSRRALDGGGSGGTIYPNPNVDSNNDWQNWMIKPVTPDFSRIINKKSGAALDGGGAGAIIYANPNVDSNNDWQNWMIKPGKPNYYLITNKNSGAALDGGGN
ncbi:MAG: RICIN domain-containing protein [Stigonema ocellatum SAG 48.90 = DSM 106950]|nr:RICIN domain-containing protein [Stigonema ocellatum SAG 48.90 = DSM 106950]